MAPPPPQHHQLGPARRQRGVVVSKSIIYGSVAFYLGRKSEETKTHRWHIYVRGVNPEIDDLSSYIASVKIHLHSSFATPVRVLTEPPFEVSEIGWGEFESKIEITFKDPFESPVVFNHFLKLYPPANQVPSPKRPVVNETYDELVFTEPSENLYKKLMTGGDSHPISDDSNNSAKGSKSINPLLLPHFPKYSEEVDLQRISAAQKWTSEEINKWKQRLLVAEVSAKTLRTQL